MSLFFFSSLAMRGNDFYFFFQYQQGNIRARRSKMDAKIDTFGQFDTRDLAILRAKKSISGLFEVFLELFGKCLSIVFNLKCLLSLLWGPAKP